MLEWLCAAFMGIGLFIPTRTRTLEKASDGDPVAPSEMSSDIILPLPCRNESRGKRRT